MGSVLDARIRVGQTVRRLRQKGAGAALVLTYHRVASLPEDPDALAIDPALFSQQMAVLAERYTVITATELRLRLRSRKRLPQRAVVVTFDDGYFDLALNALPILTRHAVPATAFISTAELGTARERWWDEIAYLCSGRHTLGERIVLESGPRRFEHVAEAGKEGLSSLREGLREHLLATPASIRASLLDELFDATGVVRPQRPEYRSLTAEEVRSLGDEGIVTVGAHTVNHEKLSALDPSMQESEILGSRRRLEAILDKPVTLFSYPYGGRDSLDRTTSRLVREAGFECAFANWFGLTFPWTDLFTIPRCPTGGRDAAGFDDLLDRWFGMGR